jgi:hypothetical protein
LENGKTYYVPVSDYKDITVNGNKLKFLKTDPKFEDERGLEIGACIKISPDGSNYEVIRRCAKLSDVTYG